MQAASYEKLIGMAGVNSEKVYSKIRKTSETVSYFYLIFNILRLDYSILRFLKWLDLLEKAKCPNCQIETECNSKIKNQTEDITKELLLIVEKVKETKIPSFLIKILNNFIEQLEDKIENYWITSDKEIKDIVIAIQGKLNQANVIH